MSSPTLITNFTLSGVTSSVIVFPFSSTDSVVLGVYPVNSFKLTVTVTVDFTGCLFTVIVTVVDSLIVLQPSAHAED